ncbi:hypothetical protein Pla8534_08620 [Lignipirellula cremea]|uniref:Uncharacterized protein n=2 Tax=Lignipirellula cremea TaxID=2528010 RepID=A0A518DMN0_9BACT|nr:hypothetical protein Pla8534_08620 [Lignipirellula cremea]
MPWRFFNRLLLSSSHSRTDWRGGHEEDLTQRRKVPVGSGPFLEDQNGPAKPCQLGAIIGWPQLPVANCFSESRKMDTSDFVQKAIGPGLNLHSKKLTDDIEFHIAAPAKFSLKELLVAELARELMIEIDGLDDRQQSMLTDDRLLNNPEYSRAEHRLSFTISNKDLEDVFDKVCELITQ